MKNLGACITLDTGYMCSLTCPFPIKTTIVFGQPLSFDMKEKGSPTSQELDAAHTKFIMALTRLFDELKIRLGCGDRKLEII